MCKKKQLTIIAVAALVVSVSLLYGVEPSIGLASDDSLKNVQANVSHVGTSGQEYSLTVSGGNASPLGVKATPLGISAASSGPTKEVSTAANATTITIATSNATPAANKSFTLSGTLKSGTTPLSGKSIRLGRIDPSGNWTTANITTTGTNGTYTFTRSESQGIYVFQALFHGDTTYAPANASLKLTVGTI